jgi:membrane fusion protein (multidrug efflux system)
MRYLNLLLPAAAVCTLLSACGGHPGGSGPQGMKGQVTVVTLTTQPVTLTRTLPGRTSAFFVAEVRPQVNGIVKKRRFTEGSDVKAGEILYDIDDRLYKAAYDSAVAKLQAAQLAAKRSAELARIDAVSTQDNETAIADAATAQATVDSSKATLEYAHIAAPISGRIGKSSVTEGALVSAGQATALATIQQLDPLYVEVEQSSSEWLTLKRAIDSGRVQSERASTPARILLEDGTRYAHDGKFQFADVSVDPTTGNFLVRAIVPNPELLLLPGMYVRAEVDEGRLPEGLLAPQQGITRDPKGNASAMVVGKDGKVEARTVQVSRTIGDKWLVVSGLSAGDRLIVEGLQKIQPGMPVDATEQGAPAAAPPAASSAH